MDSDDVTESGKSQRVILKNLAWNEPLVHSAILLAFCAGNLYLPWFFSRFHLGMSDPAFFEVVFFVGVLASEVALTATMGALSNLPIAQRMAIGLVLLCLAASTYVLGLRISDRDLPLEPILFIYSIAVVGYMLVLTSLILIRLATGLRIAHGSMSLQWEAPDNANFSIGFLMAITGAAALIIAIVRPSMTGDWSGAGMPPFYFICGAAIFVAFSVLVYLPCIGLALSSENRLAAAFLLMVDFLVLGPLALGTIHYLASRINFEGIACFYAANLGLVASSTGNLLIWRLLGYRLASFP